VWSIFVHGISDVVILTKKRVGPHFGRFFDALIWSPCHPIYFVTKAIFPYLESGLPEFSWYNIPKRGKYTKLAQNKPNGQKIYQMAANRPNVPKIPTSIA
jgi:hypothetical protein